MNDNNIYKKLRIIFLFLAIVCMLFSLFKKVHAAEMDPRDVSYIEDIIDGVDNYSSLQNDLEFVYNNFPYFVHFHQEYFDIILFTSDTSIASRHYNFTTSDNLPDLNMYYIWGFRGSQDRMYITGYNTNFTTSTAIYNPHTTSSKNEKIFEVQLVVQNYHDLNTPIKTASLGCFCLYDDDMLSQNFSSELYDFETGISQGSYNFKYNYFSNSECRQNWVSSSTGNTYQEPFQLRGWNGTQYHFNGSYGYLDFVDEEIYTNHTTWLADGNQLNTSTIYGWIEPNIEYPASEDTPNFNVFVYNENDVDYVRFVAPKHQVPIGTHSSNNSTLSFDLYKDELSPVTYNFDSSSAYYYESLDYGRAYYQIPFSILIDNLGEYENVYLNNVVYHNEWSNQGGETGSNTFYKFSDTFLKENTFVPTPPDNNIPHSIYDGEITAAENQNIDTIFDKKSGIDNRPYFFISADAEWNFNYDIYTYYFIEDDNNTSSENETFLERIWTTINNVTNLNYDWQFLYRVVHGNSFSWDSIPVEPQENYDAKLKKFQNKANELMENNAFTQSFDIIIFACYFKNPPDEAHRYAYITVFTDRYKSTVNNYMLRKIYNKMADEMKQLSDTYSMLDTRINNIDSNFYGFVSSYNSNSGKLFRLLNTLNGRFSNLSDNLIGILNRIFDALGDLELSQLDAIDSKLSTIINNLPISSGDENEIDTVKECIEYYKDNTNSNGLPTLSVYQNDMFHNWFTGKVHDYLDNDNSNIQQQRNNILVSIFDSLTAGYDSIFDLSGAGDYIGEFIDYISGNGDHNNSRSNYMTHFFSDSYDVNTYSGWVSGDE